MFIYLSYCLNMKCWCILRRTVKPCLILAEKCMELTETLIQNLKQTAAALECTIFHKMHRRNTQHTKKDLQATGWLYLLLNQPRSVDKDSEGRTVILHMLGEIKDLSSSTFKHWCCTFICLRCINALLSHRF